MPDMSESCGGNALGVVAAFEDRDEAALAVLEGGGDGAFC
jgi:hypothetical protein